MKWTCRGHTYERRGRQMHSFPTHFLVLMPVGQITPYYLNLYFAVGFFLQVPPVFRKHLF